MSGYSLSRDAERDLDDLREYIAMRRLRSNPIA
jgi:plasmid stabilization system protein ParE